MNYFACIIYFELPEFKFYVFFWIYKNEVNLQHKHCNRVLD